MDASFLYLAVGTLALFVIYELVQVKHSDLSQKVKLLSYFSSALMGIYIASLLYIGPDTQFLIVLSIFCVPFWIYYTYARYKEDKKNVLTSLGIAGLMVLTIWFYSF